MLVMPYLHLRLDLNVTLVKSNIMSRYILSARLGAATPVSPSKTFETTTASARDELPRVTMPQKGARILFWRGGAIQNDRPTPSTAQRIEMVRQRLDCHRSTLSATEARIEASNLSPETLRAEHQILSALLASVDVEEARVKTIRESLSVRQDRFLASWRVTEREILATDSRDAHRDVQILLRRIKRCQVDVSGRLLDVG